MHKNIKETEVSVLTTNVAARLVHQNLIGFTDWGGFIYFMTLFC